MTDNQKSMVTEYRQAGYSYTQISKMMDLSINSVKTYCKRHGLGGFAAYNGSVSGEIVLCESCGRIVPQNPGRKHKKFCSNKCRMNWWNTHQEDVKRKANYEYICVFCKKPFMAYGNSNRKYCSHECYVEDRFGGGC